MKSEAFNKTTTGAFCPQTKTQLEENSTSQCAFSNLHFERSISDSGFLRAFLEKKKDNHIFFTRTKDEENHCYL